jgi:hypothetical protein
MAGNPQEGRAEDLVEGDDMMGASAKQANDQQPDGGTSSSGGRIDLDAVLEPIPRVEFRPMSNPLLPPKP